MWRCAHSGVSGRFCRCAVFAFRSHDRKDLCRSSFGDALIINVLYDERGPPNQRRRAGPGGDTGNIASQNHQYGNPVTRASLSVSVRSESYIGTLVIYSRGGLDRQRTRQFGRNGQTIVSHARVRWFLVRATLYAGHARERQDL